VVKRQDEIRGCCLRFACLWSVLLTCGVWSFYVCLGVKRVSLVFWCGEGSV